MEFIKYNANPKGWKVGDCVIRAVAVGTLGSWDTVFDRLSDIGKKKCRMPNDPLVYGKYLKDLGFIEEKQLKYASGRRYLIEDVVDEHPFDILLIHCAHHLTVAIRGHLIDTWNCGGRTSGKYWRLPYKKFSEIGTSEDDILGYIEWLKENRMKEKVRL